MGTLLAVALFVLSSAASAYAECAWVLWVVRSDQRPAPAEFDIAATYVKVTECVAKLDETERTFRAPTTAISRDASTVLHVMFWERDGSFGREMSWLCPLTPWTRAGRR
jgi:hypothetical protein